MIAHLLHFVFKFVHFDKYDFSKYYLPSHLMSQAIDSRAILHIPIMQLISWVCYLCHSTHPYLVTLNPIVLFSLSWKGVNGSVQKEQWSVISTWEYWMVIGQVLLHWSGNAILDIGHLRCGTIIGACLTCKCPRGSSEREKQPQCTVEFKCF